MKLTYGLALAFVGVWRVAATGELFPLALVAALYFFTSWIFD